MTCLRSGIDETVAGALKFLGFDYNDDCDLAFASVQDFCFVMPPELGIESSQLSSVQSDDLYMVPCSFLRCSPPKVCK